MPFHVRRINEKNHVESMLLHYVLGKVHSSMLVVVLLRNHEETIRIHIGTTRR